MKKSQLSEDPAFAPHQVEWNPQKVYNVWQHYSNNPSYREQYFSYQAAKKIINYVRGRLNLKTMDRIVDFGCGPGHLLKELVKYSHKGQQYIGLDFSKAAVEETKQRLTNNEAFAGAFWIEDLPSPLESESVDLIFILEVVEHLDDAELEKMNNELYRLLKPGGVVVITTPNAEKLPLNTVICPDCGCIFHRWQHMRSWNLDSLQKCMSTAGFITYHATATSFLFNYQWLIKFLLYFFPRFKKNLIYFGKK